MNTRNIVITTSVLAGAISLGFLSYYFFLEKEEPVDQINEELEVPEVKAAPKRINLAPIVVKKGKEKSTKQLKVAETHLLPMPQKTIVGDEFPLQLGSKGKRVERLQIWLLRNYGYTGKLTKVFDEKTLSLVKKHLKTKTIDEKRYQQLEIAKPVHEQATSK
jgi:hypothetical protein